MPVAPSLGKGLYDRRRGIIATDSRDGVDEHRLAGPDWQHNGRFSPPRHPAFKLKYGIEATCCIILLLSQFLFGFMDIIARDR